MTAPTQTEPLKLSVSNFGPIAKAEIDLRPMTVFVGPSNTGKSYLAILIYALHRFFNDYAGSRFFGFRQIYPIVRRMFRELPPFDDDNAKRLVDWLKDVFVQVDAKNLPVQLPDFMEPIVRSSLSDLSNLSEIIAQDIERSFGIEGTAKLIRHGHREGAKVILRSKPFEYQLALKRGKLERSIISISEDIPLYINPRTQVIEEVLIWVDEFLNTPPLSRGDARWRQDVQLFMCECSSWILSNVVSPLNSNAHYLPADRTGVMHAYRVVVASLIEGASHGGIRRGKLLPVLSGVLADFLENLVGLSEPRRQHNNKNNLAAKLEQQLLKGEIHSKNSETGYPMFSYQPHGWREDLPLMNSSSMVSELAPVVLYLRHIVQPGDVLIIEEPESHLHPKMQVEFIRQLAAVVHSGVRVMLTTHSEWVLDELANLVHLWDLPKTRRKGVKGADFALNPEEVGVWLFEPKQRPRGSVVKEIPFDAEFGGFRSGFDDVALGTYNDYAEISNRIERLK